MNIKNNYSHDFSAYFYISKKLLRRSGRAEYLYSTALRTQLTHICNWRIFSSFPLSRIFTTNPLPDWSKYITRITIILRSSRTTKTKKQKLHARSLVKECAANMCLCGLYGHFLFRLFSLCWNPGTYQEPQYLPSKFVIQLYDRNLGFLLQAD